MIGHSMFQRLTGRIYNVVDKGVAKDQRIADYVDRVQQEEGWDDISRDGDGFAIETRAPAETDAAAVAHEPGISLLARVQGAVARGWCHPANAHKEMDANLAFAITNQLVGVIGNVAQTYLDELEKMRDARNAAIEIANSRMDIIGKMRERIAELEKQPSLDDIEQYRMQMTAIMTAASGHWKEGDAINPDYDTLVLHDVAKLYARYNRLYKLMANIADDAGRATDPLSAVPSPNDGKTRVVGESLLRPAVRLDDIAADKDAIARGAEIMRQLKEPPTRSAT